MKIQVVQANTVWARPEQNLLRLDALLDGAERADLYVLPEMFSTGFATQPAEVAEPTEGPALHWMRQKAQALGAAVAGSLAVAEGGRYYNRFCFVKPDGAVTTYDKRHLFAYGGEARHYTRGEQRVVVEMRGVRFLLQVCYDLRFPVWSRQVVSSPTSGISDGDYDVALYVANWPESRRSAWDTLLRARAIENQCYVVGCNRVGSDPACRYSGGSVVVSPYGRVLAACRDHEESTVTVDVDMEALRAFRQKFPVLADADRTQ